MDALDDFKRTLNDIDTMQRRADQFAALLAQACEDAEARRRDAERQYDEAKEENPLDVETLKRYESAVQDRETELVRIRDELEVWQRELRRRTVITYCTAFETFLRDFLVEWLIAHPNALEHYIQERLQFPALIGHQFTRDQVDDLVTSECDSFQSVISSGKVSQIYRKIVGKNPFGRNFLGNTFTKHAERNECHVDIQILFNLRHVFVHRNGQVGNRYKLPEESDNRLHNVLKENYPSGRPPEPDAILISKSVNPTFDTKMEEFAYSLLCYATHITEFCM